MNTPSTDKGQKLTQKKLAPVERHLRANPGSVRELAGFLSKSLGRNVPRQRVTRWFAADETARPEPVFSTGLLMLEWLRRQKGASG